jgi:hypothetical protein
VSLVSFIRNAWTVGRQAKDNVAGIAAFEAAYAGNAALEGIVLAFTGTTPVAADNLTSIAIMENLDKAQETVRHAAESLEAGSHALELGSQTLAGAAHQARELEAFLVRLRGAEPLREILEG